MKKTKILFLTNYFPKPTNKMMGTWALSQAQALKRNGVDIKVVSFTSYIPKILGKLGIAKAWSLCPKKHSWDGLEVEYPRWLFYQKGFLKKQAYKNPKLQMEIAWLSAKNRLFKIIKEFKPDFLICNHTIPNGYIAKKIKDKFNIPYIITDHDFKEIKDCKIYTKRKKVYENIVNNAKCMISLMKQIDDDIKSLFSKAKTKIIYNGTDKIPEKILKNKKPKELQNKTIIFSAGIFYKRKGFSILIKAFSKIAKKHSDVLLRIAGDGEERKNIEKAIQESGVKEQIQLMGFQSHERVLQEMVWSDAFALTGWNEPFATVFIEAMSAAKPVITCSDGGITDVVKDNIHGYVIPPKDVDSAAEALEKIMKSKRKTLKMGKNAKKLVETALNWDNNAKEIINLLTG